MWLALKFFLWGCRLTPEPHVYSTGWMFYNWATSPGLKVCFCVFNKHTAVSTFRTYAVAWDTLQPGYLERNDVQNRSSRQHIARFVAVKITVNTKISRIKKQNNDDGVFIHEKKNRKSNRIAWEKIQFGVNYSNYKII